MAKPAQSRCHSFGRLLRLLAVRRARAANSKTSFCALDHVAALPRLLSNDEAEALADCTACSSCLVSVLCVSSEWWRCVCGVLGTGSSRSPRRSGIRVAPKSRAGCHRVSGMYPTFDSAAGMGQIPLIPGFIPYLILMVAGFDSAAGPIPVKGKHWRDRQMSPDHARDHAPPRARRRAPSVPHTCT